MGKASGMAVARQTGVVETRPAARELSSHGERPLDESRGAAFIYHVVWAILQWSTSSDSQGGTGVVGNSECDDRPVRDLTSAPDLTPMSGVIQEQQMSPRLTYDGKTDVAYLQLRATDPTDVIGPALFLERDLAFHGFVIADFTLIDGVLVGFEFQFASACLPAELLATAERIDGQHAARRFGERIGRLLAAGGTTPKDPANRGH
jgi:hypothetical protein